MLLTPPRLREEHFPETSCDIPWRLYKRQGTTSVVPRDQQRRIGLLAPASSWLQSFVVNQRPKPESKWATCGTTKVVP
jgi:hypothetical protein